MNTIVLYLVWFMSNVTGDKSMQHHLNRVFDFLPERILQWQRTEQVTMDTPEKLYEYMNGGAELYLSYGLKTLFSSVYLAQNQPELIVDIFDMGSPENAFGIFSHSREKIDSTFGQGSQYTEGLLLFWKNNYYISILASPETVESKQALVSVANTIDTNISEKGELPALFFYLPRENLVEESVRFFHHHFWLNAHYFIAENNILNIDRNTSVILARYRDKMRSPVLVLIQYGSPSEAETAKNKFLKNYFSEEPEGEFVPIEDGSWCGVRQNRSFLTIIFNASEEAAIADLFDKLNWESPQ